MFDEFLRERAERDGEPFVPFDAADGLRRVRRRPPRCDGVRDVPGLARHRLPEGADDPPGSRRRPGRPQERRSSCDADPRATGVEVYEGSVRFVRARPATRGLRTAVVSSSANAEDVLRGRASSDLFEARIDGVVAPSARACRASPRPTRSCAGAEALGVEPRAGRRLRGRPGRRRGRPRRRLRLGRRRRPRRPGRRAAHARRRHRRGRPRRAAGATDDRRDGLRGRAVGVRETRPRPRRCSPRASRSSPSPTATSACAATSTRASRTALPGHLPQRRSTSCARCRTPRRPTATPRRARRSSTSPTASSSACSSTTSRSTSATATLLRHERVLDLRAGVLRRDVEWRVAGRPRGPRRAPRGSSRFAQRSVAAIDYEVEPLDGPLRIVVQSELVANEPVPARDGRPARGGRAAQRRSSPSTTRHHELRAGARPPHARAAACAWRPGMDHVVDGPGGHRHRRGERARPRPRHGQHRAERRASRCASSSSSPTAGRASARARRCATRSTPRWPPRQRTGWEGLLRRPARATSTTSGSAPTSRSTATPRCSRRCASPCSTCCRPARAPSAARSPPRA